MNGGNDRTEKRLLSFESICRKHGLSITPQRVAIYKELISSLEHPSAVMIFNRVREYYSNISLDTVNRTLLTFNDIGLAKIVESSGDPKRFDPNLEPHHHFRCIKCGKIEDFKNQSYDALEVPPELKEKFTVMKKIVHLEGYCDKCRASR
jgi:Fur family transcriptional regulator, peroxide stress response regulator